MVKAEVSMVTDTRPDQPLSSGVAHTLSPGGGRAPTERAFGLAIAKDGTWWHEGAPIRRIELARLFATVLRREADGSYWLVTPVERGRIAVEDVPFVAVELTAESSGRTQRLRLRSNLDEWVTVGPEHPLSVRPSAAAGEDAALVPYVEVRRGLGARLERAVYYQLVELAEELDEPQGARFGVWSEGRFFALDRAS
jgi:hypothetical protein